MPASNEMDELAIRRLLRQDASFVKRTLRDHGSRPRIAYALFLEVSRLRPRKRLVTWLCAHLSTITQ